MSAHPPQSHSRRYWFVALKLSVSVVLLSFLFSRIDVGRLWTSVRTASIVWLIAALAIYALSIAACVWRWHVLLEAQGVRVRPRELGQSYLVALFFNNFLPSNIGGDVIRIRDTARLARSKTLATTVVLVDRGLGLMGLVLVAACGASLAAAGAERDALPFVPAWLWAGFLVGACVSLPALFAPSGLGRLLQPLRVFHPEWIGGRIESLTSALSRFRDRPAALAACFAGAVFVQAMTVVFYTAAAYALRVAIRPWDLAVIVPASCVVQMIPVSINGFGVREATFSLFFARIGLPIESALLVSLVPTGLAMLFSLSGAAVYVTRTHRHHHPIHVER
jgi:uncharacterized membrane protein YbhN (UPF0104 family)